MTAKEEEQLCMLTRRECELMLEGLEAIISVHMVAKYRDDEIERFQVSVKELRTLKSKIEMKFIEFS